VVRTDRVALGALARKIARRILSGHNWIDDLPRAFAQIGRLLKLHRVYLLAYQPAQKSWFRLSEWTAPGITSLREVWPEPYLDEAFGEVTSVLRAGKVYSSLAHQRRGDNAQLGLLSGNQADLVAPILVSQTCWGALGLDDCSMQREWTGAELEFLRALAGSLGNALALDALRSDSPRQEGPGLPVWGPQPESPWMQQQWHRIGELERANHALQNVASLLTASLDPHRMCEAVLLEVCHQVRGSGAAVWAYAEQEHTLRLLHVVEPEEQPPGEHEPFRGPVPAGITPFWETLLLLRKPLVLDVNDPGQQHLFWPGTREWHAANDRDVAVGVPLLLGDKALGFLGVTFRGRPLVHECQLDVLQAIGQQIALAFRFQQLAGESVHSALLSERSKFSAEIHDGLAANFAGIALQLRAVEDALESPAGEVLHANIRRARELASFGLAEARRAVLGERATLDGGLIPALAELASRCRVDGVLSCRFSWSGEPYELDASRGLHLFRMAQEAVNNATRHAHATLIDLALVYDEQTLTLTVRDNGAGMDPRTARKGLAALRARAESLGALLRCRSGQGRGTRILVSVPRSA
jgi:signal transduction histidine kinase